MYRVYARDKSKIIDIGHAGENKSRCVIFDISPYKAEFGAGTWSIVFSRDTNEEPYLVTDTYELDDNAVWELTNVDTAIKGRGRVELRYKVNDVLVKTDVYTTELQVSLGAVSEDPPTPTEDLLDKISEIASSVKSDKTAAEEAAINASASAEEADTAANTAGQAATVAAESAESASAANQAAAKQAEASATSASKAAESAKAAEDAAKKASEIVIPGGLAEKIETNAKAISDLSNKIDERTINSLFRLPRTGKVYTVKIPKSDSNPTTVCEKLDDNAGLVCEPSTDTVEGQDDYENIPLFKWYNCNYVRDANGHAYPTAIEGIDSGYKTSGDVDVGAIQMAPYIKWDESADDHIILSITDSPKEGYELWSTARYDDAEYPYVVHSKYFSGLVNGLLRSQPNLKPERFQSYINIISNYLKKGEGYHGAECERNSWQIIFTLIKYTQKSSQAVFAGCTNYSFQYAASIQRETKETYFPITKAQAANIVVGGYVSVGYQGISSGALSLDRYHDNLHKYADDVKVLKVEPIDDNNSAVYLDIETGFDTMPVAVSDTLTSQIYLSSMHWRSGATDKVKGKHDGSPVSNMSGKYPYRVQGIEYAIGGYFVASDVVAQNQSNIDKKMFAANKKARSSSESVIVSTYKEVDTLLGNNGADYWIGDISFDAETCVFFASSIGSGSTTGVGDRQYVGGTANSGTREWLIGGGLWDGSYAGSSYSDLGNGLGRASWYYLSAD